MNRVIALELPPSPEFISAVRRIWEEGDAVFPVDLRLPIPERRKVMESLRPTHTFDGEMLTTQERGLPGEEGDAVVIATSGTTGHPKGVVLTHDAVRHAVDATCERLEVDPASDKWLLCIPAAHVGGFSVIARAILTGTPIVALPRFSARRVEAEATAGATLTALVPTALQRIDPSRFRKILLGGSAIPAVRPINTVATYGMTETFGGIVYDGRPLRGVDVRVVDGEISVKSPTLLRAYRSGGDTGLRDGWLATGDAGSFTDGVLHVDGRIDEMIVTGGEKVWPSRVEEALAMHPQVFDVAVTGRSDPEWTEAVTAIVVPIDSTEPPSIDELRSCVKAVLPSYMAPHRVEYRESIPRSGLGKIKRSAL